MNQSVAADNSVESLISQVADEYVQRLERGEQPHIEEYASRYPQIAATLRQVLPALQLLRQPASGAADSPAGIEPEGPLGDYRIVREIGRGGMGVVYEAVQISLGRRVALKVLPFAAALDAKQLQRFKNEAQAAAHLHHTNIVPVHAVGCERGVHYYAMQYIEGSTLAAVIWELRQRDGERGARDVGRAGKGEAVDSPATGSYSAPEPAVPAQLSEKGTGFSETQRSAIAALSTEGSTTSAAFFRTVVNLGVQAAEALEHAHGLGVIHRDIKPANLLSDMSGNLWITDFGLARLGSDAGLTMTGDLLGTIRYMSPEQALAKRVTVDARTDVYSLGVTLYELLTLEPAYDGRNREEVLRQIAFEEPRPPRHLNKGVPAELETIVLKAMAKNPEERYGTAQEVADDLRRFLEDKPIRARRPSLRQRAAKWARRHRTVVRAAVVVLVLAVAGLAVSTALIWRANESLSKSLERERIKSYFQCVALADREWSANNLSGMEEQLDACPVDLRGWEWHYLKGLRRESLPPLRHEAPVFSAAISSDGERIASASQDGVIKIWNGSSGRELVSFHAHEDHVRTVAYSPDGQFLASGSWDRTVRVWDVRTDQPLLAWEGHANGRVDSVAFSPDGQLLASGSGEPKEFGELKIWDASTGRPIWARQGHENRVTRVSFSPDGRYLASGSSDRTVKVWDWRANEERASFRAYHGGVWSLAFSPDGRLLAWGDTNVRGAGNVKVWDWQAGQERFTLGGYLGGIWSLAFSPDGRRLASGGMDQTVKVWDVTTGHEALTLRGHKDHVWSVAFSRDGHRLISASSDRTVQVWDGSPWRDGEPGQELLTLRGHLESVNSVAFHPQGRLLVSGGLDGTVKLWDPVSGKEQLTLRVDPEGVHCVTFSPDGTRLAAAGKNPNVRVWEIDPSRAGMVDLQNYAFSGSAGGVNCVLFSPDGMRLASAGFDGIVRLWDLTADRESQQLRDHTWAIFGLAFSPDGRHLVSGSNDATVRLWDVTARKEMSRLQSQPREHVCGVAFSPEGNLLAAGSMDRTVRIWEKLGAADAWRIQHRLPDPTGGVLSVTFSPDGRRLVWGSTDGTVKVCELASEDVYTLRGHTSWVWSVACSPDGKYIASASRDGTVKIWKSPPPAKPPSQAAGAQDK
jgi:WD40 repeat protein/serine/threonine protein kinase